MKKILASTDFSNNSKSGIRFAAQLASQSKSELELMHVVEIMKPTSWSPEKYHAFIKTEIARNKEKLEKFAAGILKELNQKPGNVSYHIEIGLNVIDLLVSRAKKIKADFICIGTQGAGSIRKLFGTHSSNLINNSSIPVITVPPKYRIKKINLLWYASDFEKPEKELKIIEPMVLSIEAKVETHHYNYLLNELNTKKNLNKKAQKIERPWNKVVFHELGLEYSLTEYMEKDIKKMKPSAVVLFTKQNRNWFSRLFLSSKSVDMSFAATIPLIVYRKKSK